jgi:hypothetical protein
MRGMRLLAYAKIERFRYPGHMRDDEERSASGEIAHHAIDNGPARIEDNSTFFQGSLAVFASAFWVGC